MRILVMGSGGIGGYFGARLALAGNDVVFTARGAHLEAMQTRRLEIRERDGTAQTLPVRAVRFPADAGGTFDAILFTVKTYDTAEAAEAIKPVVGPKRSSSRSRTAWTRSTRSAGWSAPATCWPAPPS